MTVSHNILIIKILCKKWLQKYYTGNDIDNYTAKRSVVGQQVRTISLPSMAAGNDVRQNRRSDGNDAPLLPSIDEHVNQAACHPSSSSNDPDSPQPPPGTSRAVLFFDMCATLIAGLAR